MRRARYAAALLVALASGCAQNSEPVASDSGPEQGSLTSVQPIEVELNYPF